MNIEEYIASGILELYVLGELPPDEAKEVEEIAISYPEAQQEIQRIQQTMQELAMKSAIRPRPGLRDEILNHVVGNSPKTGATFPLSNNASHTRKESPLLRYGLAASIALTLIAGFTAFYFHNQWKEAEQRLNNLLVQNQQIVAQYEAEHQEVQALTEELSVMTNPNFRAIEMTGLDPSPNSLAYAYWNQNSNQLYLKVSALPPTSADKQYQLWAIVDGKPVNAGVFDVNSSAQQKLISMKNIENASAFAVTLEPRGGSESPTLDAMYVKGAVENI